MSSIMRFFWLGALFAVGCGEIPEVDAMRYSCASDSQCGAGFVCKSSICVPADENADVSDVTNSDSEIDDSRDPGSDASTGDTFENPDGVGPQDVSDATDSSENHGDSVEPLDDALTADADAATDIDAAGPDTNCVGSTEACNGLDDDCDGNTDEDFPDPDGDQKASCVDPDDDGDGLGDSDDGCPTGRVGPLTAANDMDGDGCHDASEDDDDDADSILDDTDACDQGSAPSAAQTTSWVSGGPGSPGDFDGDGCRDSDQDKDDDEDGVWDTSDSCSPGIVSGFFTGSAFAWTSDPFTTDFDSDGCRDSVEDEDIDEDGIPNANDGCNPRMSGGVYDTEYFGWTSDTVNDHDFDGCADDGEDNDDDNDKIPDALDNCDPDSNVDSRSNWDANSDSGLRPEDHDQDGCQDSTEDLDDDNDGIDDSKDECPCGARFQALLGGDIDFDGCHDAQEDIDEGRDTCLGCGPQNGTCEYVSSGDGACGAGAGWLCVSCASGRVKDSSGRCVEAMQLIPGGDFTMGSTASEPGSQGVEWPAHPVRLRPAFYMTKFEATRGEWQRVSGGSTPSGAGSNGCTTEQCPVANVDLYSVVQFLNAKSREDGLEVCYELTCSDNFWGDGTSNGCSAIKFLGSDCDGYRLPTEAEWEFAARAGTQTATYAGTFSQGGGCTFVLELANIAVYCGSGSNAISPVGTKAANAFGLHDMLGNVSEWVWGNRDSYPSQAVKDPQGPTAMTNMMAVVRGGNRASGWQGVRAAAREHLDISTGSASVGFRYVRSAPLVNVPSGRFTMGSVSDPGRGLDEEAHQALVSRSFLMQPYEVTQREWRALAKGNNPSYFAGYPDSPVENVDWYSALAYLNAMSAAQGLVGCYELVGCLSPDGWEDGVHTGCQSATRVSGCNGYRLPTEAEWEYAARAGTTTATYAGTFAANSCSDSSLVEIAWYCGNSGAEGALDYGPKVVGTRKPNDFLLFDMLGNVLEWVSDWYGPYDLTNEVDPTGPAAGTVRVARGGAFLDQTQNVRAAHRQSFVPNMRLNRVGLRAVRDLP